MNINNDLDNLKKLWDERQVLFSMQTFTKKQVERFKDSKYERYLRQRYEEITNEIEEINRKIANK